MNLEKLAIVVLILWCCMLQAEICVTHNRLLKVKASVQETGDCIGSCYDRLYKLETGKEPPENEDDQ